MSFEAKVASELINWHINTPPCHRPGIFDYFIRFYNERKSKHLENTDDDQHCHHTTLFFLCTVAKYYLLFIIF